MTVAEALAWYLIHAYDEPNLYLYLYLILYMSSLSYILREGQASGSRTDLGDGSSEPAAASRSVPSWAAEQ
jgi:hypothetical protein